MAIILEGPDASGKTTLGRRLAEHGFELIQSGGAPTSEKQLVEYCELQIENCGRRDAVIDRISPISHLIYNPYYKGSTLVLTYLSRMAKHSDTIIVYCRPPNDILMMPEKHEWKDYDTEAHKQKVLDGQMGFIQDYDDFFEKWPHIQYDYTHETSREAIVKYLIASKEDDIALKEIQRLAQPYKVPA